MSAAEQVRESVDALDSGPARRLAALLDLDHAIELDELPPLWHWVYFLDAVPQRALGVDGHPVDGIPRPPGPDFRRMFAGGRAEFRRPLQFGEPATRRVELLREVTKPGRTGPLTFATVQIAVSQAGALAVVEHQDIVYLRSDPAATQRRLEPRPPGPEERPVFSLDIDATLLFRFSALTYNAHRIHYDRDYARSEGHSDLVIHGPLQALLLSEAARRSDLGPAARFAFTLHAPAYGAQQMTAYTDGKSGLSLSDDSGRVTATASVNIAA